MGLIAGDWHEKANHYYGRHNEDYLPLTVGFGVAA